MGICEAVRAAVFGRKSRYDRKKKTRRNLDFLSERRINLVLKFTFAIIVNIDLNNVRSKIEILNFGSVMTYLYFMLVLNIMGMGGATGNCVHRLCDFSECQESFDETNVNYRILSDLLN